MSPEVTAAIIAASVSFLTLIGTLAAQYFGRRATGRDTEKTLDRTFAEQREQLSKTLAEQREQLDRTLAEQRTRTLNERFATAAEQLAVTSQRFGWLGCMPWRGWVMTGRRTDRPVLVCCAPICACRTSLILAKTLPKLND
jgi:hypothetical protein